jgi:hypothetical protein
MIMMTTGSSGAPVVSLLLLSIAPDSLLDVDDVDGSVVELVVSAAVVSVVEVVSAMSGGVVLVQARAHAAAARGRGLMRAR